MKRALLLVGEKLQIFCPENWRFSKMLPGAVGPKLSSYFCGDFVTIKINWSAAGCP